MPERIVIVGGGITGLAAAWYLQQKGGYDITIVESSPRFGGKIDTIREDGFVVECGPDSFLTTKPRALDLVNELGLHDELISPTNNEYYIVRNGTLVKPPRGLNMFVPVDEVAFHQTDFFSEKAKQDILAEKDVPAAYIGEDESLAAFVTRRFGAEMLRNYAEPLFAGIYATAADEMSIMTTLPILKEYEKHYGNVTAGIKQSRKPSIGKPLPMFLTLKDGLIRIVETLLKKMSAVKMLSSTQVASVEKNGSAYTIFTSKGPLEADKVLITTPAFVTAKILGALAPDISNSLTTIPYTSTAILTLALPQENLGEYSHSTGFVIPHNERINITASTFSSAKWPYRAPEGYSLVRCFFGSTSDQRFRNATIDDLEKLALSDLKHYCGITKKPVKRWFQLWENSLPQYHVGHTEFIKRLKTTAKNYPGLYFTGASFNGVGLPDCIRQAWEAAEELQEK